MFVTSAVEVAGPGIADLLLMIFDDLLDPGKILVRQSVAGLDLLGASGPA